MANMTVDLSDELQAWAEKQAVSAGFDDVNAYLLDLIRADQAREQALAKLQALVDEADASGYSPLDPDDLLEQARQHATAMLKARNAG